MKRYIIVAFAFLGFAFYELSGGADFDPTQTRLAAIELREQLTLAREETARVTVTALVPVTGSAPVPANPGPEQAVRTELNLVSFETAAETLSESGDTELSVQTEYPSVALDLEPSEETIDGDQVQLSGFNGIDGADSGITFAGLSTSASSANVTLPKDIRLVAGSLVNLRAGPGSGFDVVAQFPEDTRVEVLEDAGNGWVQLRPVDGGPTGWMADFLLADG